jgi:hypothetical protein
MRLLNPISTAVVALIVPYLASAIPSSTTTDVDHDISNNICTVRAIGHQRDDTPNILEAFHRCGHGGTVVFPQGQNYWIATKLNPVMNDVVVRWHGVWTVIIPRAPRVKERSLFHL